MFDIQTQRQVFHNAHRSDRGLDIKIILHLPLSRMELTLAQNDFVTPMFLRGLGYRQAPEPWEYLEHENGPTVEEMIA